MESFIVKLDFDCHAYYYPHRRPTCRRMETIIDETLELLLRLNGKVNFMLWL